MKKITPVLSLFALLILASAVVPSRGAAQQLAGAIAGTVTDSSGAFVKGAKVKIVNSATKKSGVTAQQATLQGTTGYDIIKLFVDPNALNVPTLAPGQNGVPSCATVNENQVCDTFETGFGKHQPQHLSRAVPMAGRHYGFEGNEVE